MAVSVVSFSFSRAAQPEAQRPRGPEAQRPTLLGDGFLYCILTATSLDPNLSGAPRAPSAWRGFPYHSRFYSNSNSSGPQGPLRPRVVFPTTPYQQLISNCLTFVLNELYNSSMPTQSPTRSSEWHVWSSSSGNNSHGVQRSHSSGVSVFECIMGFFTLSHFISQARLHDFLS